MPDPVSGEPQPQTPEVGSGPPPPIEQTAKKATDQSSTSDAWLGFVIWGLIIGGLIVYKVDPVRKFFVAKWWVLAIAFVLLIAVIVLYAPLRRKIQSSIHTRAGTIILALAGIAILEGAISVFPSRYQILALRSTFLLIVCLFPVVLYYLFITTRKYSLLNEFITSLDRLGLLAESSRTQRTLTKATTPFGTDAIASNSGLNLRILTYVQKFEAVYGSLDQNLVNELLDAKDPGAVFAKPDWNRKATTGFISIFTPETTAPLVIATGLIALGWIIALPPWKSVEPSAGTTVITSTGATPQTGAQPVAAPSPEGGSAPSSAENSNASLQTQSAQPAPAQGAETTGAATQQTASTPATPKPEPNAATKPKETLAVAPNGEKEAPVSWLNALYPDESPVYFAFLGSYFFGIQMLFRRYVVKDLRTGAYVAVSMRIILAVVGTWVLIPTARVLHLTSAGSSDMHTDSTLLVLGFVIGVFPPVIWQFLQAAFKKVSRAAYFLPSLSSELPLSGLDGLTVWHESRLEEEDIENIPNMATANVVDLMLNTRFSPDRIVDWIDQSILYMHLGPEKPGADSNREKLRAHGIRTATALITAYRKTEQGEDATKFEQILPSAGRSRVRTLVDTLFTSPNLELVRNWRGLAAFDGVAAGAKKGTIPTPPRGLAIAQSSGDS
jgi:hypothetical protein